VSGSSSWIDAEDWGLVGPLEEREILRGRGLAAIMAQDRRIPNQRIIEHWSKHL
jgi:hypothetical protein